MIQELFTLNNEYMVELNREWISTIDEFKILLRRDRGSKGDADGRKKIHAQREFTFIYHYCDFKSQYREYPEYERWTEALKNAGLTDGDVDDAVKAAIERYKSFQETRSLKLIDAAYVGIDKLREYFLTVDLNEKDLNDRLVNDSKKLSSNIKDVGHLLNSIKELEDMTKAELEEKSRIRGGAKRGNREDRRGERGTIEVEE
jgi:hypothetical protein